VVIAIIAILIGLLVPAVQKVREAAARTQTINNIKQCCTATHNFAGTYQTKMPINGYFGARYASVFGHLLPFVEQDNVYKLVATAGTNINGTVTGGTNASTAAVAPAPLATYYGAVIPSYQCPSDPTAGASTGLGAFATTYGITSIASNGNLFNGVPGGNFAPPVYSPTNGGVLAKAPPRLPATFASAGTSNVVMFGTRYATCGTTTDTVWANASPATGNIGSSYFFSGSVKPIQQTPAVSAAGCDITSVQTYNAAGAQVGMGDASVRSVSAAVSNGTWIIVTNPTATAVVPSDWDQ